MADETTRASSLDGNSPEKETVASTSSPIETPEYDPANPRNWSPLKKGLLFTALMSSSLLADGAMTWGATLIVPQAMEWHDSISHSATSMNYGILLQGFGGMFALPLIEAYGRLPIWLWPQVLTMFMVLGATLSNDWNTFTAFRSLQGLFGTVPQVIGLPIIHDMYDPKGITTTIDTFLHAPPYLMDNIGASSMRFAGVIGALCGFGFGYFFNKWIYNKHSTQWRAEYRLHGVWVPIAGLICGLLTYGLTLEFQKHWIGLAFGWVLVNMGMIAFTVAITSYALEKYPDYSTCVSCIINMWRTCGGFSVGYFQPSWIARNKVGVVFGIQAAVVAVCIVLTIPPVIISEGRKLRRKR
ncbi:hypothetical protein FQN50_006041 [Emmonsiellopsis sp. PD_5]|nr:hypothetical protein FQN50_006041 [Emmonsiellopsis sp. PD_5]